MKYKILFPIIFFATITLFFIGLTALAQENNDVATTSTSTEETVVQEVEADQAVTPDELGLKEPKLLPNNPFYFAKDWWRGTKLFFTFNPVKKAELRQKITDEKLLEIKKMVKRGVNPKILERAKTAYENQQTKLQTLIERLKEKKIKNPKQIESFKEKFVRHQILHNKILEKLEGQVPEQAYNKIKEMREKHLRKFGETMFKLEDKDKVPERLEKALRAVRGSEFKDFKALEFLKEVKGKIQDEDKKEKLAQVEERITERLKTKIEQLPPERQDKIKAYIENIPGDKAKQLEILEELRGRIQNKNKVLKKLEEGREMLLKKIVKENLLPKEKNCPSWTAPAPGFCENGRIIIKRDKNGCPTAPICISFDKIKKIKEKELPLEKEPRQLCAQIWDPVCGKDGKTYSNACMLKISGQEIAHKGVCTNVQALCAKEGQRVNRNPFIGPTDKACCPGLVEKLVSRSYSVCVRPENLAPSNLPTLTPSNSPAPSPNAPTTCAEKCKSLGYSGGICRSWPVTASAQIGCKEGEKSIGQTSDCKIPQNLVGRGKACCCQK